MNNGPVGKCERCGEERNLTKHRKIPGCRGGTYNPSNVVKVCRPCHNILDAEIGVREYSVGRTGRYVPCEKCGDITERIEVGLCRHCRDEAKGPTRSKSAWLRDLFPTDLYALKNVARWKIVGE